MNGFTNQQIIGGLVTVLIASYAAFFLWVVASIRELHSRIDHLDEKFTAKIDRLEEKFTAKIDRLDEKFTARIDRLEEKFTAKIEALTIAVSRLEGAVYHVPPERRPAASEVT
jgi:predicted PurR-regulated permease PerM